MTKAWLLGFILLSSNVFAQEGNISKVINLNYVSADKVIQLVQPLLQPGEKVSGNGQTLVVNVSPQTLTQIRTVLNQLDVAPITFNVSIYQGDPNWLSAQNNNTVSYSTQPQYEVQRTQSVKVMSGESAFVSTDQQVPIVSSVGVGFFTGISYQQHNIKNGLLVKPVLQGSQVKLTIRRARDQQDPSSSQVFDNQNIDTTVMAPLNKWVSLGSAEGAPNSDPTATSYTTGRPFSQNSTLYIKVSVVSANPVGANTNSNDVTEW
ncbi:MAG: type II/III secretion system protein [Legionella sp.]|nr:MAG: type II/III secretion system protein [Legionella sp.]